MRLVPVYFCFGDRAIFEPNCREAFQLSPVGPAKTLFEDRKIADSLADRDRLDASDFPDDLEMLHEGGGYFISARGVGLTDLGFSRAVPLRAEAETCEVYPGARRGSAEPAHGTASAANQS